MHCIQPAAVARFLPGLLLLLSLFSLPSRGAEGAVTADTSNPDTGEQIDIAFFEYPPLAHLTSDGRLSGYVIETVREICFQAGLNCHFRILPVARVYRSVFNGDASVIITGRHPSFDACCSVADWQFPWDAGIYSRAPLDMIADTDRELEYHRMIIVRGWRSPYRYFTHLETMAEQGLVKLSQAQDNLSAIRMLEHNRAEYMWGGGHFKWYLKKLGLENEFHFKPLISSPLGLWVDKNRLDVLIRLNEGYRKLQQQGLLDPSGQQLAEDFMARRYRDPAGY